MRSYITRFDFHVSYSRLMEQIPSMRQQREARDEGAGHGIYFEQTVEMELNAMFPMPDPSEAGSSTGSCSAIHQTPLSKQDLPLGVELRRFDKYVHDYLVKKGLHLTADLFAIKANVVDPNHIVKLIFLVCAAGKEELLKWNHDCVLGNSP
ncbi:putative serine/threonine-protein kinase HT1-like [Capsicum annuum]|uniref:Uncharacterized protein n=1 Tax=Capsicum annuum TaxID=4072 RepID=A0A2G2ZLH8_CAPAN|nr:putative serine/threonine-protein kinase HT1-like [Capsicum annuum]PHT82858.1 hypothetical protein T459_11301 [Capsicum annuum]